MFHYKNCYAYVFSNRRLWEFINFKERKSFVVDRDDSNDGEVSGNEQYDDCT